MKSERNNLLIEKKQLVIKFSMGYDFFRTEEDMSNENRKWKSKKALKLLKN